MKQIKNVMRETSHRKHESTRTFYKVKFSNDEYNMVNINYKNQHLVISKCPQIEDGSSIDM